MEIANWQFPGGRMQETRKRGLPNDRHAPLWLTRHRLPAGVQHPFQGIFSWSII